MGGIEEGCQGWGWGAAASYQERSVHQDEYKNGTTLGWR